MLELLRLAWGALWERRGRTVGAVIGVAIAFTALSFALGLGNAFRQSTLSFFEGLGINNVFLLGQEFTDADVALVRAYAAPYASAVIPISVASAAVRLPNGRVEAVTLYGVSPSDIGYVLPSSAILEGQDLVGGGLAIAGYYVAFDQNTGQQELYPGYPLVLSLNGRSYTLVVSGIMSPEHPGVISTTSGVVVSMDQFKAVTGLNTYQIVVISLKDTKYIDVVQSLLKPLFPNAEVLTLTSLVETVNQFFTGLELFLGLVSGVSTVITALWLYDTMTISAIQRTREFGILRAIGFRRSQITAMMIYEAAIIALIGIAAGTALLAPLSLIKINFFSFPVQVLVTPQIAVGVAALVMAVNVAGALVPAIRAGRMNLIDALRYE